MDLVNLHRIGKITITILLLALGGSTQALAEDVREPPLALPAMASESNDADPVPLEEYWRRIDAAADLLAGAQSNDGAAIAARAGDLISIEQVELPGGEILSVDNGDLVAILRRDNRDQGNLDAILARLRALQRARDLIADRPAQATEQVFEHLEEVLARPEFARAVEPAEQASLLQRLLDWLGRTLARWLGRAAGLPGMEYLFITLGVALALAVLAYFFRGAWQEWVAEGRSRDDDVAGDETDLSSGEALRRADGLAAAGDYRQAARLLYLSTLLWLDERRLLRYDPALTNREFLRQIAREADRPGLYEALSLVVELFDRVWYGFAPLDDRGYAAYAHQVERVRQVSGGGAG